MKAAQRVIDYTSKHYATGESGEIKVLRQRMIQAGLYDPRAVAFFFLARTVFAVALAAFAFLLSPVEQGGSMYWLFVGLGGIVGYLAPSLYIDHRIRVRKAEHLSGFPDFMDLLVVCADAGLSMEASLDRVGRELGVSYPSLTANIHMANLEIRAGRTMSDALEHLGDRLGLEEARSFATLIQQSEELGSSITEALRVYSDDMRHKRLSRAEALLTERIRARWPKHNLLGEEGARFESGSADRVHGKPREGRCNHGLIRMRRPDLGLDVEAHRLARDLARGADALGHGLQHLAGHVGQRMRRGLRCDRAARPRSRARGHLERERSRSLLVAYPHQGRPLDRRRLGYRDRRARRIGDARAKDRTQRLVGHRPQRARPARGNGLRVATPPLRWARADRRRLSRLR